MKIRSFPSKLPMALHYLMDLGLHCLPLPHKKDYFVIEYILQHLTRHEIDIAFCDIYLFVYHLVARLS